MNKSRVKNILNGYTNIKNRVLSCRVEEINYIEISDSDSASVKLFKSVG